MDDRNRYQANNRKWRVISANRSTFICNETKEATGMKKLNTSTKNNLKKKGKCWVIGIRRLIILVVAGSILSHSIALAEFNLKAEINAAVDFSIIENE